MVITPCFRDNHHRNSLSSATLQFVNYRKKFTRLLLYRLGKKLQFWELFHKRLCCATTHSAPHPIPGSSAAWWALSRIACLITQTHRSPIHPSIARSRPPLILPPRDLAGYILGFFHRHLFPACRIDPFSAHSISQVILAGSYGLPSCRFLPDHASQNGVR
jgi:hypothetical protein